MKSVIKMELILLAIFVDFAYGANVACQEMRYKYQAKGMDIYDVPLKPQSGSALQICPQGPTCCTPDMEFRLGRWSSLQYREAVNNKTAEMAAPFNLKANKLHDFMEKLFDDSQKQFHEFFKKTYGVLYDKNSHVFREYFAQLRQYFYHGRIDLIKATETFFSNLYQKMFQVMNSQYSFDGKYLRCVGEHMDQIGPFGEIPKKMASSVKKSMVASRAMYKAVRSAYKIADKMKTLEPTKECLTAVQKMNSCPACQGYTELKPCSNYCINVMKGCLVFHIELQNKWDEFTDTLAHLGDRLLGPLNLEMVVLPLNIQISGAIMSFQDTGLRVTQKVFQICGTPKTSSRRFNKREAEEGNPDDIQIDSSEVELKTNNQKDLVKSMTRKSDFDRLMLDIKKLSQDSQGFWRHLPYVMCDQPDPAFQERLFGKVASKPSDNDQCWNGKDSGPYNSNVVEDGLAHLLKNPEMEIRSPLIEPSLLKEQTNQLTQITLQLKSAHGGQDVKWWDEEFMIADQDQSNEGSGDYEGSGDDYYVQDPCQYSDDEDCYEGSGDDEDWEGSGAGTPTEIESWAPWVPTSTSTDPTTATTPSTTTTTTSTTTTRNRIKIVTAGSPNITPSLLFVILASFIPVWLVL